MLIVFNNLLFCEFFSYLLFSFVQLLQSEYGSWGLHSYMFIELYILCACQEVGKMEESGKFQQEQSFPELESISNKEDIPLETIWIQNDALSRHEKWKTHNGMGIRICPSRVMSQVTRFSSQFSFDSTPNPYSPLSSFKSLSPFFNSSFSRISTSSTTTFTSSHNNSPPLI